MNKVPSCISNNWKIVGLGLGLGGDEESKDWDACFLSLLIYGLVIAMGSPFCVDFFFRTIFLSTEKEAPLKYRRNSIVGVFVYVVFGLHMKLY